MKTRLILIVVAICILISGFSVYAEGETGRGTIGAWAFMGKLFYCDLPTNRVVIKSVAPVVALPDATAVAKEAEYLEIKVSPDGLRMKDGTATSIEDLNIYVDSNVWFVVTKGADGYLSIPYLSFR